MKNHPAMLREAFQNGADWVMKIQPLYCAGCGQRLSKCAGVVHYRGVTRCIECFTAISKILQNALTLA
jgi:hypothetical protein